MEVKFGLNPNQPARGSGLVAQVRFGERPKLHDARFEFGGGTAQAGLMNYARLWFRNPVEALVGVVPTTRFDVLQAGAVIASGEVVSL